MVDSCISHRRYIAKVFSRYSRAAARAAVLSAATIRLREAPTLPGVTAPDSARASLKVLLSLPMSRQATWGPKKTPSVSRAARRVAPSLCAPISSGGWGC